MSVFFIIIILNRDYNEGFLHWQLDKQQLCEARTLKVLLGPQVKREYLHSFLCLTMLFYFAVCVTGSAH